MNHLLELHCEPRHGQSPLAHADISRLLDTLPGWSIDGIELTKWFHFANYHETMAFVNALAWIAHQEDHHPDLSVHYNRVQVRFSTHDAGGLTLNDFICVAKTEALLAKSA